VLHELNAALAGDAMVLVAEGRVLHQGACGDPATHRALESVFDRRVSVLRVAEHWIAMPR
jgi:iron complex transport system ATP-binding protein